MSMPLDPVLGQIMPVSFNMPQNIPRGWHLCDGSLLPIGPNQALFSLLGTSFGGDGQTTFGLPDLRGRAVVGQAAGVGAVQGTTTVTLTDQEMPSHNHVLAGSTTAGAGRSSSPANNLFGVNTLGSPAEQIFATAGSGDMPIASGTNVQPAGSSQPHNNMQPYLVVNYMIATSGIYPSRL
jgi:microcystin-dependent protein